MARKSSGIIMDAVNRLLPAQIPRDSEADESSEDVLDTIAGIQKEHAAGTPTADETIIDRTLRAPGDATTLEPAHMDLTLAAGAKSTSAQKDKEPQADTSPAQTGRPAGKGTKNKTSKSQSRQDQPQTQGAHPVKTPASPKLSEEEAARLRQETLDQQMEASNRIRIQSQQDPESPRATGGLPITSTVGQDPHTVKKKTVKMMTPNTEANIKDQTRRTLQQPTHAPPPPPRTARGEYNPDKTVKEYQKKYNTSHRHFHSFAEKLKDIFPLFQSSFSPRIADRVDKYQTGMERHLDAMRATASELYKLDQKDEYTEFEEYNKYYKTLTQTSLNYLQQDDGKSNDGGSYEAAAASDAEDIQTATSGTDRGIDTTAPDLAVTKPSTTQAETTDVEVEDLGADNSEDDLDKFYTPATTIKKSGFSTSSTTTRSSKRERK